MNNTLSNIAVVKKDENGNPMLDEEGEIITFTPKCVEEVCQHTNEERQFISVVDQSELEMALEQGYTVKKVYNALIWEEKTDEDGEDRQLWTTELFKGMKRLALLKSFRLHPGFREAQDRGIGMA